VVAEANAKPRTSTAVVVKEFLPCPCAVGTVPRELMRDRYSGAVVEFVLAGGEQIAAPVRLQPHLARLGIEMLTAPADGEAQPLDQRVESLG
jgi:DNA mismatch repair protein MutH